MAYLSGKKKPLGWSGIYIGGRGFKLSKGSLKVEFKKNLPCPQSRKLDARGVWPERRTARRWIQIPHRASCYETVQKSQFGPVQTTDRSEDTHTPASSPA